MKLLPKQEHAVYYLKDSKTNEILYGGAAGGGKSALGCLWLIENCQMYAGSRWLMGRSKLKSLKETTLNTFFDYTSQLGITNQYNYNQQSGVITWNNGSEIILKDLFLYPSDPNFDSLGSLEITGAFVDECNQVTYKAWQVVKSRIRYKLNEFDLIPKMLGTCNPAKNWVYSQFYSKDKNNELEEYRKFIQALPKDNPHLPQSYIVSLLELDQASKERLYYGNWEFDNDPAKLVDYDKIIDLFRNNFVEGGEKYISVDAARYGSDKAVIVVWDGFRVKLIKSYDKSAITMLYDEVMKYSNLYKVPINNIIVDDDGVGGGLVDMLKCKGFVNNSKPFDESHTKVEYSNLKSQCYFHLADYINKNLIHMEETSDKDTIIQELEQIKRDNIDSDGKLTVLSKKKIKELLGRSPDYSDALMMRMYFELAPKGLSSILLSRLI